MINQWMNKLLKRLNKKVSNTKINIEKKGGAEY
jgi:hypothetical protein